MSRSTTHFALLHQYSDFISCHQHQSCVRLILVDPQLNHQSFSLEDVFELREQHSDIINIEMQTTTEGRQKAVICFGSVDDVVEFQFSLRSSLTYSLVYIESSDFEFGNENPLVSYSPEQLEQEIDEEGFFKKNGLIHMKKVTSIEHLIYSDDCEICEKSTLFQTERKISIDEEMEENYEEESKEYEEPLEQKKSLIKPFIENILITVLFFGGVKLFKMLAK